LDFLIGGGNVVRCKDNGDCQRVTGTSLRFPNGLARDRDGLVLVAFTAAPYIGIYRFADDEKGQLEEVGRVRVGMPVDNLSVDANGDIWTAGFPNMFVTMEAIGDPFNKGSPAAIFKIYKTADGRYEATKVLEDGEAKFVSGATVAVFDAATERLFIGGMYTLLLFAAD
jgi:hypothetical protein